VFVQEAIEECLAGMSQGTPLRAGQILELKNTREFAQMTAAARFGFLRALDLVLALLPVESAPSTPSIEDLLAPAIAEANGGPSVAPAPEWLLPCLRESHVSRVCEKGTRGCNVKHRRVATPPVMKEP